MSNSTSRRVRRNLQRLVREASIRMTKPDRECDSCTKELAEDCYLTCPDLFQRNRERNKDLLQKIKDITGDQRI